MTDLRCRRQSRSAPAVRRSKRRSAGPRGSRGCERSQLMMTARGAWATMCGRPMRSASGRGKARRRRRRGRWRDRREVRDGMAPARRPPSWRIFSISRAGSSREVMTAALRFRLRHAIERAERQRLQLISALRRVSVDAMMMARIGLLLKQLRQRGDAVDVRHLDIEHHHIGIDALELDRSLRGRCASDRPSPDPARHPPSASTKPRATTARRRRPSRGSAAALRRRGQS